MSKGRTQHFCLRMTEVLIGCKMRVDQPESRLFALLSRCPTKVEVFTNLRPMELNGSSTPIVLSKHIGINFQLACNIINRSLRKFCEEKASFVFEKRTIISNTCEMLDEILTVPLLLHISIYQCVIQRASLTPHQVVSPTILASHHSKRKDKRQVNAEKKYFYTEYLKRFRHELLY